MFLTNDILSNLDSKQPAKKCKFYAEANFFCWLVSWHLVGRVVFLVSVIEQNRMLGQTQEI